ncbi:MAG: lamin tail domain-containing protein, partial [Saprospiraceae bacterium]
ANVEVEVAVVQFSPTLRDFNFSPDRPNTANRNGNFSTFTVSTSATNAFSCSAISRITAFNTVNVQTQQVCGSDVASNAPYDDGWSSSDNGGTNLGAWTLSTSNGNSSQAGFFIGSSNINTGGESFGMYANSAQEANAVRPFLNALIPGTVFSLQMDNGSIQGGGAVGFSLRNASNQNVVEFYFEGGEDDYERNDAGGEQGTGVNFTNTGLNIQFTLLTASTYQLSISRLDGGGNQVINGTLMNPAGGQAITQFRLFNFNAGSVGAADAFFNSFGVCYPPTLIINEVDYDQGSTDDAEFIELRNVSNTNINLDNYTLELVDGTGSIYQTVDLPNVNLSPGNYYVICANATNTPNCDLDITPDIDLIQDGAPDGIRIRLGSLTVDALSYEGTTPGAIEGTTAPTDDGTAARVGLSRIPDGNDTNNNASDFQLACITPGSANANTTACPTINFSLATSSVDEPTTGTTTLLISAALTNYLGSPIALNISAVGSGANPAESPQDYILNTTSLVFNQSGIQFITVAIQREFMDEDADEFFTLNLTIPSANASLGTPSSHLVTIVDNAAVLPIELLDFTATSVSESVLLKWSTATEKNNAFFSVQRSRDGLNWVEIGQVKGKGNSSVLQQYAFTDKQPQTGINYYRLQQFDFDGQSSFTPVRFVEIQGKQVIAKLFPNPTRERFNLQLEGAGSQMYKVFIYNTLGQEIWTLPEALPAGESYEIPTTWWTPGLYFMRISDTGGQVLQILTIQKQ